MAEKVDCPVCGNIFSAEEVANHVDKCLFLNSSNDKNVSLKRSNLPSKSPNSGKRLKTGSECSVMDFKVPSQMMEADESFSEKSDDLRDMAPRKENDNNTPLAELMRPSDISQFVGQKHVLGQDKILFKLIQNENIPSMILWGPPGCGKTTLAHIIAAKAKHCRNGCKFVKLSATMDGVKDVKEIVKLAKNELSMFKRKTLLFMDEIHRFNKLQQRSHMLYDKKGDEHYNTISALHKSLRAGDDNATLYWLARMLEGGEDPMFIARRLVRAASEDVGLADPQALQLAVATMQGCQLIGMPECDVLLAQCAVYLSRAPKSREMDNAIAKARECVRTHKGPLPSIPLYLRNAPTRLMKDLG
ncbi:hypothetical protein J437_LFUL003903 [Ladona fulva]|uniref:Uncharacterized protein n=1 Tax=Ladona fulva TaxID=123851 RepID=A0A8K0P012_LADFU|nr:hypothetical protein J437_LFUL003903 [Ladona fulva]